MKRMRTGDYVAGMVGFEPTKKLPPLARVKVWCLKPLDHIPIKNQGVASLSQCPIVEETSNILTYKSF